MGTSNFDAMAAMHLAKLAGDDPETKIKAATARCKADPHPRSIAARLAARRAAKAPAADWYADPEGGAFWRWWDGSTWTHHTHPRVTS